MVSSIFFKGEEMKSACQPVNSNCAVVINNTECLDIMKEALERLAASRKRPAKTKSILVDRSQKSSKKKSRNVSFNKRVFLFGGPEETTQPLKDNSQISRLPSSPEFWHNNAQLDDIGYNTDKNSMSDEILTTIRNENVALMQAALTRLISNQVFNDNTPEDLPLTLKDENLTDSEFSNNDVKPDNIIGDDTKDSTIIETVDNTINETVDNTNNETIQIIIDKPNVSNESCVDKNLNCTSQQILTDTSEEIRDGNKSRINTDAKKRKLKKYAKEVKINATDQKSVYGQYYIFLAELHDKKVINLPSPKYKRTCRYMFKHIKKIVNEACMLHLPSQDNAKLVEDLSKMCIFNCPEEICSLNHDMETFYNSLTNAAIFEAFNISIVKYTPPNCFYNILLKVMTKRNMFGQILVVAHQISLTRNPAISECLANVMLSLISLDFSAGNALLILIQHIHTEGSSFLLKYVFDCLNTPRLKVTDFLPTLLYMSDLNSEIPSNILILIAKAITEGSLQLDEAQTTAFFTQLRMAKTEKNLILKDHLAIIYKQNIFHGDEGKFLKELVMSQGILDIDPTTEEFTLLHNFQDMIKRRDIIAVMNQLLCLEHLNARISYHIFLLFKKCLDALSILEEIVSTFNDLTKGEYKGSHLSRIIITLMIELNSNEEYIKASKCIKLLRELHINPITVEPIIYASFKPVNIAIICFEINLHTGHYQSAINVLKNNRFLKSDCVQLTDRDYREIAASINNGVKFLLSNNNLKIALLLFSDSLSEQKSISTPKDLNLSLDAIIWYCLKNDQIKMSWDVFMKAVAFGPESDILLFPETARLLLHDSLEDRSISDFLKIAIFKTGIRCQAYNMPTVTNPTLFVDTSFSENEMALYILEGLKLLPYGSTITFILIYDSNFPALFPGIEKSRIYGPERLMCVLSCITQLLQINYNIPNPDEIVLHPRESNVLWQRVTEKKWFGQKPIE